MPDIMPGVAQPINIVAGIILLFIGSLMIWLAYQQYKLGKAQRELLRELEQQQGGK